MQKIQLTSLLLALTLFFSCNSGKDQQMSMATLQLNISNAGDNAKILVVDPLEQVNYEDAGELFSGNLPESGEFSFNFFLPQARLLRLTVGDLRMQIWLEPGAKLQISADVDEGPDSIAFSGDLASESQAFLQISNAPQKAVSLLLGAEAPQFEAVNDSIHQAAKALLTANMSPAFLQLANMEIDATYAALATRHSMYYYSKHRSFPEVKAYDGRDFLSELLNLGNKILESPNMRSVVGMLFSEATREKMNDMGESMPQGPTEYMAFQYTELESLPTDEFKQFFKANMLMEWMDFYGIEGVSERLEAYRNQYPASPFLKSLNNQFTKWDKLSPGNPAIDFAYESSEGETIALSDFKGKVVYLDVWATWCGPCLAEFPSSKVLKAEYEDRDDIVFMYVSIDDLKDKEKWLNFLKNDPEFKGIHMMAEAAWRSQICQDYMINGIPRYMLFDKEGNISDSNAPRPSSGEKIRQALDALAAQ